MESTKSVSEIYAPLTGKVVLVNEALDSAPETLNKEPYDQGWIFEVEISTASELESLLSAGDYASLTAWLTPYLAPSVSLKITVRLFRALAFGRQ